MDSFEILCKTMYHEGGSTCGIDEVLYLGWVIRNRVEGKSWFGKTYEEVCLKKWQFSCWNEGDPNKIKMERLQKDDPAYLECLGIISGVLVRAYLDETEGANHYHTKGLNPRWRDDSKKTAEIGNHVFYRL